MGQLLRISTRLGTGGLKTQLATWQTGAEDGVGLFPGGALEAWVATLRGVVAEWKGAALRGLSEAEACPSEDGEAAQASILGVCKGKVRPRSPSAGVKRALLRQVQTVLALLLAEGNSLKGAEGRLQAYKALEDPFSTLSL